MSQRTTKGESQRTTKEEAQRTTKGIVAMTFVAIVTFVSIVTAQQAPQAAQQAPQAPAATFRTTTRLIVQTVSVKDKDGRPIEGLTAKDFTVTEDGQPQM